MCKSWDRIRIGQCRSTILVAGQIGLSSEFFKFQETVQIWIRILCYRKTKTKKNNELIKKIVGQKSKHIYFKTTYRCS
jgi:hypothetical protein